MSFAPLKSFEHQDWTPVVLRKTDKKIIPPLQPGNKQFQQLDGDEPEAPKTVGLSVGKQIQQARTAKKMTQKDLAQKINVKPSVIQEYETGSAIPEPKVTRKISQVLGIKIA
jgi:putative transcription factor